MLKKAVFLDRDGVLNSAIIKNNKPYPPASLDELHIPNEVPLALAALRAAGYLLIGVTNQPDVARGTTSRLLVEAINSKIMQICPLDEIRVCYHDDSDQCACRKPQPGLIVTAAQEYAINLERSIMIGDRWKDIEAGQRAGCKTIWLDRQYAEKSPDTQPDFITTNFSAAVEWILRINK